MVQLEQLSNKMDRSDGRAVTNIIYLFMITIIIGNFVQFHRGFSQIKVLSPRSPSNVKIYDRCELKTIRGLMNGDPRLKVLPPSTILRIRSLKIQKK